VQTNRVELSVAEISNEPQTTVDKIDFKKKFSTLYSAPIDGFATVDVPVMTFVKIPVPPL